MIRRFQLLLVMMVFIGAIPGTAFAQDEGRSAPKRSFFGELDGYLGGVEVSFQTDDVENDPFLSLSFVSILFENQDAANNAIVASHAQYPELLWEASDDVFSYSGILEVADPEIGDDGATYAGVIESLTDEFSDFGYVLHHVRVGPMVLAMQAYSAEEVPTAESEAILQSVIARNVDVPVPPIDASEPEATIWEWLPIPSDLPGTYSEIDRLWRNTAGQEFAGPAEGGTQGNIRDFFAGIGGYVGGASVTYNLTEFDAGEVLLFSGGVAQYSGNLRAINAMVFTSETYLDYIHSLSDDSYDLSGVEEIEAPELGDTTLAFGGPVIGIGEDTSDLYLSVVNVRVGAVIFGLQATTTQNDPTSAIVHVLTNILEREPEESALPINGDDPEAAIWEWVATFDDLPGEYTMAERQWTDADGAEYAVETFEP